MAVWQLCDDRPAAVRRSCGRRDSMSISKESLFHVFVYLKNDDLQNCGQTVCIISAVSFTGEAVCSKSSLVAEAAFRMLSFQSYFCGRRTAAVKFLRPQQLFCFRKIEIRRTAAAANISATV